MIRSASRKDLRTSTAEGTAASITVGIGETYLPAFVLALSGSQLACGLVTTLPLVVGAVLQLVPPWGVRRWRSYRRWVVFCVALQAATFLPLAVAASLGSFPLVLVFAVVSVYWAAGLASAGPWNVWMETLVPGRVRTRYFAWRTRIGQWGMVAGFLLGGIALRAATHWHWLGQWHAAGGDGSPLGIFALLFVLAAASRLTSASLLAGQREPVHPVAGGPIPPPRKMTGWLADGVNGRLLLYLLAVQAAVQIAAPYFNPYMLGHLKFSYTVYAVVICGQCGQNRLPARAGAAHRAGGGLSRVLAERRLHRTEPRHVARFQRLPLSDRRPGVLRRGLGGQRSGGPAVVLRDHSSRQANWRADGVQPCQCGRHLRRLIAGRRVAVGAGDNGPAYLLLFALSTVARAAALVLLVRTCRRWPGPDGRADCRARSAWRLLGRRPSPTVSPAPAHFRALTGRARWHRFEVRSPPRNRMPWRTGPPPALGHEGGDPIAQLSGRRTAPDAYIATQNTSCPPAPRSAS